MNLYEVKLKSPSGKITSERQHAESEQGIREAYAALPGYEILEITAKGDPIGDEIARLTQNNPEMLQQVSQPTAQAAFTPQPLPAPGPQYEYFEDSGTKLRFNKTKGQLEKQAWVDVTGDDLDNFALVFPEDSTSVFPDGEIIPMREHTDVVLKKLDWIPVNKVT